MKKIKYEEFNKALCEIDDSLVTEHIKYEENLEKTNTTLTQDNEKLNIQKEAQY